MSEQYPFNNRRGRDASYRVQGEDIVGCAEQALRDLRSGQLMTRAFRHPGGFDPVWQRSTGMTPTPRPHGDNLYPGRRSR